MFLQSNRVIQFVLYLYSFCSTAWVDELKIELWFFGWFVVQFGSEVTGCSWPARVWVGEWGLRML